MENLKEGSFMLANAAMDAHVTWINDLGTMRIAHGDEFTELVIHPTGRRLSSAPLISIGGTEYAKWGDDDIPIHDRHGNVVAYYNAARVIMVEIAGWLVVFDFRFCTEDLLFVQRHGIKKQH